MDWIGNQRFRDLIDERREEYTSCSRFGPKKKIAKEIVDQVHSLGGRFLKLVESDKQMDSIVEEGVWEEVSEKVAKEKAKQGLRQKHKCKTNRKKKQTAATSVEQTVLQDRDGFTYSAVPPAVTGTLSFEATMNGMLASSNPLGTLTPMVLGSGGPSVIMDPRLALFQSTVPFAQLQPQQPPVLRPHPLASYTVQAQQPRPLSSQTHSTDSLESRDRSNVDGARPIVESSLLSDLERPLSSQTHSTGTDSLESRDRSIVGGSRSASDMTPEKEDAFLALSALSVAGLPRFSAEQEALERASLTTEEKADVLADMFGSYCNIGPRQNKRAKKDLDRESIDFLVNFMRSEIAITPPGKKQALMEAQTKCEADEFSDARLETFLRCEGMNAKLAARRFISYWESRLEVFGPTKYLMRMTLSEALRADLAAIEAAVYCQLPYSDSSGRQLLWLEPHRHTKVGYTSESLVSILLVGQHHYPLHHCNSQNIHCSRFAGKSILVSNRSGIERKQ